MATYNLLSSQQVEDFYYSDGAWLDYEKGNLAYCMVEMFPTDLGKLIASDKHSQSWFLGRAVGEPGKGKVQVIYPYESEQESGILRVWNVNYFIFPFLTLKAIPEEGCKFVGWFTEKDAEGILLSYDKDLVIGPDDWPDQTSFFAHFRQT